MAEDEARLKLAAKLLMCAIRYLKERKGSTIKRITSFIGSEYNMNEEKLRKPVALAVRRGLKYGLIRRHGPLYRLIPEEFTLKIRKHKHRRSKGGKKSKKRPMRSKRRSKGHGKPKHRRR